MMPRSISSSYLVGFTVLLPRGFESQLVRLTGGPGVRVGVRPVLGLYRTTSDVSTGRKRWKCLRGRDNLDAGGLAGRPLRRAPLPPANGERVDQFGAR